MTITVQDKAVEEKIEALARRTGLDPVAVIARAIENEERRLSTETQPGSAKRVAAVLKLLDEFPPPTEEERRAIDQAMEDMYDEHGLPR